MERGLETLSPPRTNMSELKDKLRSLESSSFPERFSLKDLNRPSGYEVQSARLVTTRFGKACVVTVVENNGVPVQVFLPKRFAGSLTQEAKDGYAILIGKCKAINPDFDEKFVKSKIDNLRSSFQREFKKVIGSKKTGSGQDEVYEPTLWYYNLLLFTTNQEIVRKGISSIQKRNRLEASFQEDEEIVDDVDVEEDTINYIPVTGPAMTQPEKEHANQEQTIQNEDRSELKKYLIVGKGNNG